MTSTGIGGYFELELQDAGQFMYERALGYQSARAAFLALLRHVRPTRVWLPRYICGVMRSAAAESGTEIVFYALDPQWGVADGVVLEPGDILLFVNYFGVNADQVGRVLERFPRKQVVLDCAQAFFAAPQDCLASIYSPRKFFGVPDGGLMLSDLPVVPPRTLDLDSSGRTAHLVKRMNLSPEAGYQDYQAAEASLADMEPRAISHFTRRVLGSIDYAGVRRKRNENFKAIHQALGAFNGLTLTDVPDGPLCYPYLTQDAAGLKRRLITRRVFVPTYWEEALQCVAPTSVEAELVTSLVALPCDQRYGLAEIAFILSIISHPEGPSL